MDVTMPEYGEAPEAVEPMTDANQSELETLLAQFPESADDELPVDYELMAMEVVSRLQQLQRQSDQAEMLILNPAVKAGFLEVWARLPEDVLPAEFRAHFPIQENPDVPVYHLITRSMIEMRFLEAHFGPQGNGLLPKLQSVLDAQRSPVRITHEFLRIRYLLEMYEKVAPRILTPGSGPLSFR